MVTHLFFCFFVCVFFLVLIYGSFSALGKWAAQQKHALKEGFQQKEDVTPEPKAVTGGIISLLIL